MEVQSFVTSFRTAIEVFWSIRIGKRISADIKRKAKVLLAQPFCDIESYSHNAQPLIIRFLGHEKLKEGSLFRDFPVFYMVRLLNPVFLSKSRLTSLRADSDDMSVLQWSHLKYFWFAVHAKQIRISGFNYYTYVQNVTTRQTGGAAMTCIKRQQDSIKGVTNWVTISYKRA